MIRLGLHPNNPPTAPVLLPNKTFIALEWIFSGQLGSPRGVAVDSVGRIIVADYLNHRVQVFDSAGEFLFRFGSQGREDGQFKLPEGVAVGSADRIIVADNSRMFGSSSMLDLLGPGFLNPAPECAEASRTEAPAPPPVAHSWRRPSFT